MSPTSSLVTVFSQADLKFICLPRLACLYPYIPDIYALAFVLVVVLLVAKVWTNKHDKGASPVSWKTVL